MKIDPFSKIRHISLTSQISFGKTANVSLKTSMCKAYIYSITYPHDKLQQIVATRHLNVSKIKLLREQTQNKVHLKACNVSAVFCGSVDLL